MTTYTVTATATDATTDRITVSSATNMFSGMPIVFSGTTFGGITAGATYYIGTIVPDYPTSTITVTSLPGGAVVGLTTAAGVMTGTFSSGGQQIINIGTLPNDGTGDPLRTAFNDTNLNFDQVFAAGPVGSNIQIANNTIKTTNTNGNLVLAPNGTGMVKSNVNIVPDQTQIRNLGAPTLRWDTVYSYNYSGNGSGLTGIVSTANIGTASKLINQFSEVNIPVASGNIYANVNSVNITTTTPDGVLVTGNVTAGNALISANIVANGQIQSNTGFFTSGYLSATGSTILANATVTGNLSVAGNVTGNLSATGNITGNYFVGNGSLLSNVAVSKIANGNSYANIATANGNVVVSANLSRWTFATTGNLVLPGNTFAVNYANGNPVILGSGGNAGLPLANGTSNFNIATTNGNATITANSLSIWTFGENGNLTLPGNGEISINYANGDPYGGTGGGTYGNSDVATLLAAFGSNTVSTTGNVNSGNLLTGGLISATGNITANVGSFFIGNGSQLTGITAASSYGNANVVANLAALGSNPISTTGNITTTANVSGGFILGNVAFANGISTYGNSNVTTLLSEFGNNTISTSGNITGGYILGNVAFANGLSTYGNANVVANLAALGSNPVSTTGNVTGGFILGNGSALTSLPAPAVTQDITSNGAMSIMTYDGNIKYVNYATVEPSSGNIAGGNITTAGLISATGNVSGNFFIGNGSALTGVTASANTGNVTFDNQAVVGTGDQVGSSGLYLAPGTESVGNLQYVRVRGGDVATHIHIDTGNNAYYDQYFGSDIKYVKLEAAGNVVIGSDDAVGNSAQWSFNTTGTTQFPGNILAAPDGNPLVIKTTSGNVYSTLNTGAVGGYTSIGIQDNTTGAYQAWAYVKTEMANVNTPSAKVVVVPGDTGAEVTWTFDAVGNLTVPGGGAIITAGTGTVGITANATSGNAYLGLDDTGSAATLYGNAGVQIGTAGGNWDFDASGNLTVPGTVTAAAGQTLVLQAAAGQNADLVSNNGNNVVYVNDTAAYVQTVDGGANVSLWTFDTAGDLGAPGNISAVGNITGAYILGNGSQLTGLPATYGNSNVATFLAAFGSNTVSTTGNITAGNLVTGGSSGNIFGANNISANTFSASGNVTAGGLTVNGAGVVTGNLQIQGNLTYNNLTNITTANLVFGLANTTTGISANGAGFVVGNTSEASFLYNYTAQSWNSNIGISAVGNVAGSNLRTAGLISATGNVTAGNVSATNITGTLATAAQTNITSVGTLSGLSVTANVTGGNILTGGIVSSTGNITGAYIIGDGSQLTGVTAYTNANVSTFLAAFGSNSISTTGSITSGNVTGGNVLTGGVISSTGNITGGNVSATNIVGTLTTAAQTNITSVGTLSALTVTANVTGGNIRTAGLISSTGNITGGNIATAGQVSATGNITTANSFVGNLVGSTVSITGNVTAGNVIVTTGLTLNGTPIVANNAANLNSIDTMTTTGNVSVGGNLTVTGGIRKSARVLTTTTTLTVADASGFIELTPGGGPYTITLPNPTLAANSGIGYRFWQNTTDNITLSTPAGAFYGPSGSSTSTKVLAQATTQYWDVWSDGFNWAIFGIKIA
jgi:filamentous hemagglutinin